MSKELDEYLNKLLDSDMSHLEEYPNPLSDEKVKAAFETFISALKKWETKTNKGKYLPHLVQSVSIRFDKKGTPKIAIKVS